MHPAQLSEAELLSQCQQRADRRGGPGGQHRNKVQTAVIVTHLPTGISGEGNERRSQVDNRRQAIFRLRLALAVHFRSPAFATPGGRTTQAASALWQQRALGGRIRCSPNHEDFPSLLAELLEHLHAADYDLAPVAASLGTTNSQLVRCLRGYPPALLAVNAARESRGLGRLN